MGWIIILHKVKAHCTSLDIDKGIITYHQLLGNSLADTWAGKGAELCEVPDTKVSINNWSDATAWLLHDRAEGARLATL